MDNPTSRTYYKVQLEKKNTVVVLKYICSNMAPLYHCLLTNLVFSDVYQTRCNKYLSWARQSVFVSKADSIISSWLPWWFSAKERCYWAVFPKIMRNTRDLYRFRTPDQLCQRPRLQSPRWAFWLASESCTQKQSCPSHWVLSVKPNQHRNNC